MITDKILKQLSKSRVFVPEGEMPYVPLPLNDGFVTNNVNSLSVSNFDEVPIPPEKLTYELLMDKELYHVGHTHRFLNDIAYQVERDMCKLQNAGIPVFINENSTPHIEDRYREIRLSASYSIPEECMYKSFFVLNEITPAVKKAAEYAMQQVQKVIDKY